MTPKLILYSRRNCCLCDEMKETIRSVAENIPLQFEEIDVDEVAELQAEYGHEVPVLFIDGRKAFKYRVTAAQLARKLTRKRGSLFMRLLAR
jgi:glutaredoxin